MNEYLVITWADSVPVEDGLADAARDRGGQLLAAGPGHHQGTHDIQPRPPGRPGSDREATAPAAAGAVTVLTTVVLHPVAAAIRGAKAGRESPPAAAATLTSQPRLASVRPQAPTSACRMTRRLSPLAHRHISVSAPLTSDPV